MFSVPSKRQPSMTSVYILCDVKSKMFTHRSLRHILTTHVMNSKKVDDIVYLGHQSQKILLSSKKELTSFILNKIMLFYVVNKSSPEVLRLSSWVQGGGTCRQQRLLSSYQIKVEILPSLGLSRVFRRGLQNFRSGLGPCMKTV